MLVPEHLVVPVGVAVIDPLLAASADFLHYPRTVRILGLVVDTGEKLKHILLGIVGVISGFRRAPEFVKGIDRPVASVLVIRGCGRLFPAPTSVVTNRGLAVLVRTVLGGDEDDTVGGAGSIDSCGGCVLDDGDALHIVRVDILKVSKRPVDHHDRVGLVDGCESTDVQFTGAARITGLGRDVETRNRALKHRHKVV